MSALFPRAEWLGNVRADFLAGLVVAMALIPEAIGFSIIAGVDPRIGLYASISIAIVIAFAGGRPGMISAATAAVAVVVGPLVRQHGVEYLFAATVLMGLIQALAGLARLDLLMTYVSRSVITGFVNALAILIFMAQLPQLIGVGWQTYAMVAATLAVIYLFPRLTTKLPSPLVAILAMAAVSYATSADVRVVADMGRLPTGLPAFHWPAVPVSLDTLRIILPYSITMAAVGLLESLLTARIVDDMTDTPSDKRRECLGQGAASLVTGLLGGMGGCAMIGQSVINVSSGGRTRLSTLTAGVVLLILLAALGPLTGRIPMPALVAVMIMVSIGTFSWASIANLRRHPPTSSIVMLTTVVVVVATRDLSLGVLAGVLLSGVFFAWKVRRLLVVETSAGPGADAVTIRVAGQVFFASADRLVAAFAGDLPHRVAIDLSEAHVWDISAVGALEKVVERLRAGGHDIAISGLNRASATMIERVAVPRDRTGLEAGLTPH